MSDSRFSLLSTSILGACHCGCFNFHTMVEHVIVSGLPLEHTVGTTDCPPLGRLVGPRASLSCTKRGHAWCSFDRIRVRSQPLLPLPWYHQAQSSTQERWQYSGHVMPLVGHKSSTVRAAIPFLSVSVAWTSKMSPEPPRTSGPSSPWSKRA